MDLFELTEKVNECLKGNEIFNKNDIIELKNIINNDDYIGLAQINTISGDIEYNAKKIAKYIKLAEEIKLKCIIFPQDSLLGSSIKDVIKRHTIVKKDSINWLRELAKLTKNTIAIIGDIAHINDEYINTPIVLHNGKINTDFKNQYFIYEKYAISLDTNIKNNIEFLTNNKAKLFINCASQTYKQYKKYFQNEDLSYLSSKCKIPSLYVNQIGANDNLLFEGISCAYNSNGELIARAKAFEEQLIIVEPYKSIGKIYPLPDGYCKCLKEKNEFSLDYENDLERTYKALVLGIKDYFYKCGLKRAVLGLSGGLDSSVCAVLLADALGKENVYGISMPSKITSKESKSDAEQLANNLGIHFTEVPIRNIVDTISADFHKMFNTIEKDWNYRYAQSFTQDNIQARSRATILWGVSNEFSSCIPIATSDKSEAYMGYATINGDMSGGYAPIADITKTKLFALARWINKNTGSKNLIPETIINKRPGAELAINPKTGKPLIAEDALMPYEFLDEIIWRIESKHESYYEMLISEFLYERHNNISKEQKTEWLNKFYCRMSTAFYKWSIIPPTVMIEPNSINKIDYNQLITSSHINYKGTDEKHITESLK